MSRRKWQNPAKKKDDTLLRPIVKKTAEPTKPVPIKPERYFKCCSCGTVYETQPRNFSKSQSPFFSGNNSYLPICVTCVDRFADQYLELLECPDEAVQRLCMHWDIYVNEDLLAASMNTDSIGSRMRNIVKQGNMIQNIGKTYDTYLAELEASKNDAIETVEDFEKLQEDGAEIRKISIKRWGFGYSVEDMEELDAEFADWRSRTVVEGKGKEVLVKDLCEIKLQQKKALKDNDIKTYRELTNLYQITLDRANLTPKIEDAADKAGERPMGVMIDMFEKEKPIPEPLDAWKDVDGIMKTTLIYFIGHLSKMLGLKNRYARMYEEEMAKYKAEIPEINSDDSEDIYEHLLEHGFSQNIHFDGSGGDLDDDKE